MEITFDNYSIAPIQPKDAWRLCNFTVANEKYLQNDFPETLKENRTPTLADLFVSQKEKQFSNKEEYLFTLKENTNRSVIGLIYVKELFKNPGQAELAYCISYQYKGKGIMTTVVKKIIEWSFFSINLNRLQIIVHESNLASMRIAEKCGFKYITILQKEHRRSNGEVVDMLLFELNKAESISPI
ncbi:MAG: GNAT family N-acetyltransferase [Croceivirga sp.]